MRKIKLVLEYDGTAYHGWQVQPDLPTVQGTVQAALRRLTDEEAVLTGASRTDAGVHALHQVASFVTARPWEPDVFRRALNSHLPADIAVTRAEEVSLAFDARRSARSKRYRYVILNRPSPTPHLRHFAWWLRGKLDVRVMDEALRCLLGEHDFSAFRAAACEAATPVRRMFAAQAVADEERVLVDVEADAFLQHMARIIVGTVVEVGWGRLDPAGFLAVLESRDRRRAGPTAPPQGLFLQRVTY